MLGVLCRVRCTPALPPTPSWGPLLCTAHPCDPIPGFRPPAYDWELVRTISQGRLHTCRSTNKREGGGAGLCRVGSVYVCSRIHTGSATKSAENTSPQNTAAEDQADQSWSRQLVPGVCPLPGRSLAACSPAREASGRRHLRETPVPDAPGIVNKTHPRGKGCVGHRKSPQQTFQDERWVPPPPQAQEGGSTWPWMHYSGLHLCIGASPRRGGSEGARLARLLRHLF